MSEQQGKRKKILSREDVERNDALMIERIEAQLEQRQEQYVQQGYEDTILQRLIDKELEDE